MYQHIQNHYIKLCAKSMNIDMFKYIPHRIVLLLRKIQIKEFSLVFCKLILLPLQFSFLCLTQFSFPLALNLVLWFFLSLRNLYSIWDTERTVEMLQKLSGYGLNLWCLTNKMLKHFFLACLLIVCMSTAISNTIFRKELS